MKFKFVPHTADLKFRSYGKTIEEAFENSAYALMNSICGSKIKEEKRIKVKISGKDIQSLLYNFLEEILFLIDSRGFLVSKVENLKINKKSFKLMCELVGDSGRNYEVHSSIKAVTYSDMFVKKTKGGWVVQVVLDV